MSKLLIFQNVLPGCEAGDPEAWRAFLGNYSPTALRALALSTPWDPEVCWRTWADALRALVANQCAALKSFSHQSEREFLVDVRAFLYNFALAKMSPSQDAQSPPAPTPEALTGLLDGLPLLHQEIVFLALAGYSQSTIEKILRITPAVAGQGLERLRVDYPAVVERTDDRCLWPAAWLAIGNSARSNNQEDCTTPRQFIRILDGQASWYDKSPAESHRAHCLHCLELWTSLLEVVAWDRTRQPCAAEKIEALLNFVPLQQEKRKASLLARMLGK
jgi:hypothetical protein